MCGIIGVYGSPDAARLCGEGLFALQHRGEESVGIAAYDLGGIHVEKDMGLVSDVFGDDSRFDCLPGKAAIGHTRYSTHGGCLIKNAQPLVVDCVHGPFACAHNGNLVNAGVLRAELSREGAIFLTDTDTEVIPHLYARSKQANRTAALLQTLQRLQGAYSAVMLRDDELVAVRDPLGMRPLSLGRLNDAFVVVSETCALDLLGAEYVRDIEPGELLVINRYGVQSHCIGTEQSQASCIFEHVYFSRPDSRVFGKQVSDVRMQLGRQLAIEHPLDVDVIVPVPDSGKFAAHGYAAQSGIPLVYGLLRNHYIGRTFISPNGRSSKVRHKLSPIGSLLAGQRVGLMDDSIVRGTTAREIVKMVRRAGAKEVHMLIACPPTISPCFYGVDTPTQDELIVPKLGLEGAKNYIGADSLNYLSQDGLIQVAGHRGGNCTACFTKQYPTALYR